MKWSYGITTIASNPERSGKLLQATLDSLAMSGFAEPRLFADDCDHLNKPKSVLRMLGEGLDLSVRYPQIRTFANWL